MTVFAYLALMVFFILFSATCDGLDNQDGANITMTTDGSQTQALYNCDTGYSITGSSLLSCLSDGTWNISPPSCS